MLSGYQVTALYLMAVSLYPFVRQVDIYEARPFIGGKVASFQDKDGNHIELGLHVFFGCYNNLFRLMNKASAHPQGHSDTPRASYGGAVPYKTLHTLLLWILPASFSTSRSYMFDLSPCCAFGGADWGVRQLAPQGPPAPVCERRGGPQR